MTVNTRTLADNFKNLAKHAQENVHNIGYMLDEHVKTQTNLEGLLRQKKTEYTDCFKVDIPKFYSLLHKEIADADARLAHTEKHVEKVNDKVMQVVASS